MVDQFTEDEFRMATFRMAAENSAMLRVLLANQIKIMQRLDIEITTPDNAYADLILEEPQQPGDYLPIFLKFASTVAGLVHKRAWEWVQMNGNVRESE